MMMSLLISSPKQRDNDIDVFLTPLLDDLTKLWRDGVRVYDAYMKECCIVRTIIFYTINYFPAFSNMFGLKTKGAKACALILFYVWDDLYHFVP
jgi:Transposase family tnp2